MTRTLVAHGAPTALLGVPILEAIDDIPPWLADRGSDVRCFDIGDAREVPGPGHAYATPDDIVVTNGMLRFQVGQRNKLTHLAVDVYKGGAWRDKGYLYLSSSNTLAGARILSVTPERACCVLSTRNEGEVFVWLHRGERGVRITHGSVRAPSIVCSRAVYWWATAPSTPTTGWGIDTWGTSAWGGAVPGGGDVEGSPLTAGLVYEATTDGGTTRVTDAQGLTRGVAVLRAGASRIGLGVQKTARSFDVGAFVATAAAGDDLADYHRQLACASEQTVRLR